MRILFLGTGAADWQLTKKQGAEHRSFSSVLIDGELLIDFSGRLPSALAEQGIAMSQIKYAINTHSHYDHYCEDTLSALESVGVSFVRFSGGDVKTVGKYTIYAYAANHGTCKDALHYIISDGEKTVFYGLDGAWLLYDEVEGIKAHKPDFAVLDATVGNIDGDYRIFEHNNLNMITEIKKSLAPYVKRFCISHMARTLHTDHKTLSEEMEKQGILVAYDGLEITL